MNKIGFNLLPWSARISAELYPLMERLKGIGYDGVEVLLADASDQAYQDLAEKAKSMGLVVNTVLVLGEKENLISPDASVRRAGFERIKWAVDRSQRLGAEIICGPFHSAHGCFSGAAAIDEEYRWSAEQLHQAGEFAQQANLYLALEAVNRFECYLANTMKQLRDLVEQADHSHVKAMFDSHHAHIEEKSFTDAIETIAPHLVHVHISENDRGTPGHGQVRWAEVYQGLNKVNYSGWYTIEAFSRADPDFANAINVWREYSDPWEIAEQGYTHIQKGLALSL